MKKKLLYIANWKMYLSYEQTQAWCQDHGKDLAELAQHHTLIICPSFTGLSHTRQQLDQAIAIGAQNCASHAQGAYTGEVSAQSIKEVGATYCIIGHSERRNYLHETPQEIACKATLLLQNNIIPIICISDDIDTELSPVLKAAAHILRYDSNESLSMSGKRNNPASNSKKHKSTARPECSEPSEECIEGHEQTKSIIFAYEPISAIGTDQVPSNEKIRQALEKIQNTIKLALPNAHVMLLYGGSVNSSSAQNLKQIPLLDGFLIGRASTDFQELKKIVL